MRRFLLIGIVCLCCAGARAATLTFADNVTVSGTQVWLRDAAVIEASAGEMATLRAVVLATAPPVGQQKSLTLGMVRMRLRQYHLDPDAFTLRGAETICIHRVAPAVETAPGVERAAAWLRTQLPPPAVGEELVITPLSGTPAAEAPADGVTWSCQEDGAAGGVHQVDVTARLGDAVVWKTTVRLKVQRWAPALVARAGLPRGAIVTEQDVITDRREIAEGAPAPLRELTGYAGFHTLTALTAGSPLYAASLAPVPVVLARTRLKLAARCGGLLIAVFGEACEDGAVGQIIRVRNLKSHQEFFARVTGAGEAEVVSPTGDE